MMPPVPTKLPSDIPKFEGKFGEDPGAHITTFHLWCSSYSLNNDTVRLRLFQRTLTSTTTKWYIELPSTAFDSFWDLANVFLNHFQLLASMMLGLTCFLPFSRIRPLIFQITSKSGEDGRALLRPLFLSSFY